MVIISGSMNRWTRLVSSSSLRLSQRCFRGNQNQFSARFPNRFPAITFNVRNFVSSSLCYEEEDPIHKEEASQIHVEEDSNVVEDRMLMKDFFTGLGKLSGNDALIESDGYQDFDAQSISLLKDYEFPINLSPACLNPLFKKYRFSVKEFCTGAKSYAFPTINSQIVTLVDAVHNPEQYRQPEIAEISEELRNSVGDKLWKNIESWMKEINVNTLRVHNPELKHLYLYYLNTRIVGDYPETKSTAIQKENQIIETTSTNDDEFEEVDIYLHNNQYPRTRISKPEDLRRYQKGSVVATVKCTFVNSVNKQLTVETWSFEGCISGQTPLNWIVTDIKGPRKANIAQYAWYYTMIGARYFTLKFYE